MLRLRLRRVGRKHDPSFRIVVTENTAPLKGKYLESVGFYNAVLKKREVNHERAKYWLSKGVQPTDVVHNILVSEGIIDAPKIAVHKRSKKQSEAGESQPAEAPVTDDNTAEPEKSEDKDASEAKEGGGEEKESQKENENTKAEKDTPPDAKTDKTEDAPAKQAEDTKDDTAEKSDA